MFAKIVVDGIQVYASLSLSHPAPLHIPRLEPDPSATRISHYETGGDDWPVLLEVRRVDELIVGHWTRRGVPAQVDHHGRFQWEQPGAARLGYGFLSRHVVRIDYPRRRLWLRRIPDAPKTFHGRPYEEFEDLARPTVVP